MRPYFIFLLARGLTSLVLALLGPGFPSAPPFMEWVYRVTLSMVQELNYARKGENSVILLMVLKDG